MSQPSDLEARCAELERELGRATAEVARLERSNRDLALAQRLAGANTWEWTLASDEVRWDPGLLELFGFTPAEFAGNFEAVRARIHPEDRAAWEEDVRACIAGEREHRLLLRICRPSGEVRWVRALGDTVRDEAGAPLRMIGLALDVTQSLQAQAELRLSEERLASFMEHTTEGFYLFEPPAPISLGLPIDEQVDLIYEGKVVECNPAMARMYGLASPAELIGKRVRELHGTESPHSRQFLTNAVAQGYRSSGEISRERGRDGETLWFANSLTGVIEDGHLLRVWGTQVDVSERVRANEAEAELRERLHHMEKLNAIGQLASGVAHDFNNQLAGILGYAELLGQAPQRVDLVQECAEQIRTLAKRSGGLTQQLLAFGRREKTVAEPAPVDLHALLRDVVGILERGIDKRIRLELSLEAPAPQTSGDPAQLQSAFLNLALNARDAMPSGGELRVSTSAARAPASGLPLELEPGDYLRVDVADTGVGMSPELRRRIFEPFYTTKEPGEGTGMGLASVFGAVEAHRGAIRVESEEGVGSRFSVFLPQGGAHDAEASAPAQEPERETTRAMVIDDERVVGRVTASLLRSLGHEVTLCTDVDEALARYRATPQAFDLLLVDLVMPKRSGRELLAQLREVDPDFEAILITGFSKEGEAERALAEGACCIVPKPYGLEELSAAVERAQSSRSSARGGPPAVHEDGPEQRSDPPR